MTRRDLMLHLLREAGARGVTTGELLQGGVGSRYSARLLELRELGHVIEAERVRDGEWSYVLTRDVERDAGSAPKGASGSLPPETGVSLSATLFDVPPARPLGAYESEAA